VTFIENITGSAQRLVNTLVTGFQPVVTWATSTGLPMLNSLLGFLNEHWTAVEGAVIGVVAALGSLAIIGGVIALVTALINPLSLLIIASALLGAAWAEDWGGIREITASAVTQMINTFNTAVTAAQQLVFIVGYVLSTAATAAMQLTELASIGVTALGQLTSAINVSFYSWLNDAATASGQLISIVFFAFTSILNNASTSATQLVMIIQIGFWGMVNEASQASQNLIAIVAAMPALIAGFAGRFTDAALKLGDSLIKGIRQGVVNGSEAIADAIRDAVQNAINAAKAALGIHSPSALTMNVIGKPMMQGIEQGVIGYTARLASSFAHAIDTAIPSAPALSFAGAGFGAASATPFGAGAAVDNRTYGGDTFNITVNDQSSAALVLAMVEERRAARLNVSMGG
jgi:hypothetical protein